MKKKEGDSAMTTWSRGQTWLVFGMGAAIFVLFFLLSGEFSRRVVAESDLFSCARALAERGGNR